MALTNVKQISPGLFGGFGFGVVVEFGMFGLVGSVSMF